MMWNALIHCRYRHRLPRAPSITAIPIPAHARDQTLDMSDRRVRQYAMSEIENKRPGAKTLPEYRRSRGRAPHRRPTAPTDRDCPEPAGAAAPRRAQIRARSSSRDRPHRRRHDRDSAVSLVPAPRGNPMIFAPGTSSAHRRHDSRAGLDAPSVEFVRPAKRPPRYRKSARHRRRLQIAGPDSSPTPQPIYRSAWQTRLETDKRTIAPDADLQFRVPRSYRSPKSTAHRKIPAVLPPAAAPLSPGRLSRKPAQADYDRYLDEAFQSCRILNRIKPRTFAFLERNALTQAHAAPRGYRRIELPHQIQSGGSAAALSPLRDVGSKHRSRKLSAFARIARYSGRYLPA